MQEDWRNHECHDPLLLLLFTLYNTKVLLKLILINEVDSRTSKKGLSFEKEEIMVNNRFEEGNRPLGCLFRSSQKHSHCGTCFLAIEYEGNNEESTQYTWQDVSGGTKECSSTEHHSCK